MEEKTIEDVPNVENATETQQEEATTITVPIPELEEDHTVEEVDSTIKSDTEEEYVIKPNLAPDDPIIKKVDEERRKYLLEEAKKAEIDVDALDYDPDGYTPTVTDDMLEMFSIYSNGIFDKDFLQIYVDQARSIMDSYMDFKENVDAGITDEDDMEYYEGLGKGYEEGRLILGMIQTEYKKLVKQFEEEKIFETQSKAITLVLLRDFFIEKFRLTDSWLNTNVNEIENIDRTKELEENISKNLFVSSIFNEYLYKWLVQAKVDTSRNPLGKYFFDARYDMLIFGLSSYIDNSQQKDNIDLKSIVTKDLNNMNYVKAVLSTMFIINNDPFTKSMSESSNNTVDILKNKFDPENYYTEKDEYKPFVVLYEKFNKIYNMLSDRHTLGFLRTTIRDNVTDSKIYKEIGLNIDTEYAEYIREFSSKIPVVKGTSIIKWGKYYTYLKLYELYHSTTLAYNALTKEDKEEGYERSFIIDMLTSYLIEYLNIVYGEFLSDINDFIKENVYSSNMRPMMFSTIITNILMQHELGFKSDFKPEVNSSGDNLYELATKVFGENYKYIIVDKNTDVLLKNVDLISVRKNYYKTVERMFDLFEYGLNNIQYYLAKKENDDDGFLPKKHKKKNKRK